MRRGNAGPIFLRPQGEEGFCIFTLAQRVQLKEPSRSADESPSILARDDMLPSSARQLVSISRSLAFVDDSGFDALSSSVFQVELFVCPADAPLSQSVVQTRFRRDKQENSGVGVRRQSFEVGVRLIVSSGPAQSFTSIRERAPNRVRRSLARSKRSSFSPLTSVPTCVMGPTSAPPVRTVSCRACLAAKEWERM